MADLKRQEANFLTRFVLKLASKLIRFGSFGISVYKTPKKIRGGFVINGALALSILWGLDNIQELWPHFHTQISKLFRNVSRKRRWLRNVKEWKDRDFQSRKAVSLGEG